MIKQTLEYLTEELAFGLGLDIADVNLDNLKKLQEENAQGLIISLLNVEEESTLKNSPHFIRKNNQLLYKEPPVFLNLNILMAFEFVDYGTSLQRLSETVDFLQGKRWFTSENARDDNPFPNGVHKLILDLQHLSFEQMNHIWSISGGSQFPSLLYKVRLVKIQPQDEVAGPEIDSIQLDSGLI
ncbi:MAG: DUF4255 domain-containing protein [Balneolaceae bacterium]|nr:DUF4255 domain-containing protein [Balneolaceae bacterium]MDR9407928.1 DUF4255 domain-containing protein [Balneolaceae bacterium]